MKKIVIAALLLSAFGLVVAQTRLEAEGKEGTPTPAEVLSVVVHMNFADTEAQGRGLDNITNSLKAVGPAATVEVVCHGPGIDLVVSGKSKHAEKVQELIDQQVRFVACANTMRKKSIAKEDLLGGVGIVPAGTVEVIRKQHEGYAYFKP